MTEPGAAWRDLEARIVACTRCPRLVRHRERVARDKRAAYRDEEYWGAPVPGFGDPRARVLIVGLAPAAHGANRTGRMFTGDRSGDWLYRALHETGFASQPDAVHRGDGLQLRDMFVSAANRCAPPGNRPTPAERDSCRPFLEQEIDLLDGARGLRVVIALGQFAYDHTLRILRDRRLPVPVPKPGFGHGVEVPVGDLLVLGSYHPSQQNTFTGKLTREMLRSVFERARRQVDAGGRE